MSQEEDHKIEMKKEIRLEYKSNQINQATMQIKHIVEDINEVVKKMNETTRSPDDDTKKLTNKDQIIPLIDDGAEETCEQINESNFDEISKDNRSNISSNDQNVKSTTSFTPSYSQFNTQLNKSSINEQEQNLNVGLDDRIVHNFENIKLNEDESIESVEATDLCQCKYHMINEIDLSIFFNLFL